MTGPRKNPGEQELLNKKNSDIQNLPSWAWLTFRSLNKRSSETLTCSSYACDHLENEHGQLALSQSGTKSFQKLGCLTVFSVSSNLPLLGLGKVDPQADSKVDGLRDGNSQDKHDHSPSSAKGDV